MKNCTITFNFGNGDIRDITFPEEELYGKEGERSLSTQEFQDRFARIIGKHYQKWNSIKDDIIQNLKDNSAVSYSVSYSQISGKEGLIPNVNVKYLQDLYPEADFPSTDVPILLLDNILGGSPKIPVSGRVLDKNGKEIFVVRNDKDSIVQLADYLTIREKVKNKEYLESLDEQDLQLLTELANKEELSPEELLLRFLNKNKEAKDSKIIINGESEFVILSRIGRIIKDVPQKTKYTNTLLNEFNWRLTGDGHGNSKISLKELAKQLNTRMPNLFPTQKMLKELFTKKAGVVLEKLGEAKNLNEEEKDFLARMMLSRDQYRERHAEDETDQYGMSMLFNAINSFTEADENPISLVVAGVEGDNLLLKHKYPTLRSQYGFSYDTVASFTREETRKAYNIYSQVKEVGDTTQTYYYVTPYLINENLPAQRFLTLNQAQEWIDEHYTDANLGERGFKDLKETLGSGRTFENPSFIPEGTIISSIDMPVDLRSQSMYEEEYHLLNKTLQDFYNYIDTFSIPVESKEIIKNKINSAEKAILFLSEINKKLNITDEENNISYPRNDGKSMVTIATNISTTKPNYYYISSVQKVDENRYRMHFIQTDESSTKANRDNKRYPVVQLLNGIAKVMQERFKVPVKVIGSAELTEFDEDINTTKAFIRNGTIYLNSLVAKGNDAFHEYAHIFLGAMKSDPELRQNYLDFVDKVLSTEEGQDRLNKKMKQFPNTSMLDLSEEVVADLYGSFMNNNLPYELSNLFASNDKIKKIQETIFDKKDHKKTVLEFDGSLEGIWKRFNSEVAKLLDDNISFIKDNELKMQRKKANWIAAQISNGTIREEC